MIDWTASKASPETAKNKQMVTVVCETCHQHRQILYGTAKRSQQHICCKCSLRSNHQYHYDQLVTHICIDCRKEEVKKYRASRYKNWRCRKCGMALSRTKSKRTRSAETKKKRSEVAKRNWTNHEYREKQRASKEKSKLERSSKAKARWRDQELRLNVSRAITLKWADPEYRKKQIASSLKRWCDPEYRNRMTAIWNSQEHKSKMSQISKAMFEDVEFKARMAAIWNSQEHKSKMSKITKSKWTEEEFKQRMMAIYSDHEYKLKMSAALKSKWAEAAYRAKFEHLWNSDEYKSKMASIAATQPRISTLALRLYDFLDRLNVEYSKEGPDTQVGPYVWDCKVIANSNIVLIDCQGNYWHTLPGAAVRDKGKFTYTSKYFPEYGIMYIWEHEFDQKDGLLDRLKIKLGISLTTADFDFDDITIDEVRSGDVKSFLDAYHYIGGSRGGRAFAAKLNGQIIGCVLMSPAVRQNIVHQFDHDAVELSRLCIHPGYHKKNFASWLVSRVRNIIKRPLIAYADTTAGHLGTVYRACSFELHHRVPADYWYTDTCGFVMRKRALYEHARRMGITESEFATRFGYTKKYGGEKLCFYKQW